MDTGSDIVVAVATHKPYRMPDNPVYLPLHVGAALHPDVLPNMMGDDSGISISQKNNEFSELTGLYWMWKNVHAPYKGLVHYRRHFASPRASRSGDRFSQIATGADFRAALAKSDIVVPKKRNYVIETIYSHYAHTHHAEQLDCVRDVLANMQPNAVASFDKVMAGRKAHMFNMFVMSEEKFDEYCAWLFPVLFELVERIDPQSYGDAFQARYPGRVSELLLDVWLDSREFSYTELPAMSPEPVDWVKKGSSFLAAKFTGKKYEQSF